MSSQANLLSSDTAHPLETFCPSRDSLSHSSSSPSIYVTFKVLQLIHTFRKRVQTRVQRAKRSSRLTSKRVTNDFCQEVELEAYDQIDRYLGRKTAHSPKRHWNSSTLTTATAERTSSENIQWLLDQLDQTVKADTHSLATVASSNKLFVQRKEDFILLDKRLSVQQLIDLIVVVKDLLKSLQRLSPQFGRVKTLCEGKEVLDSNLDDTYLANLEHLLLCLEDQLLRLLIAKLVEVIHKHVVDCQRDQSKLSEDWFFEFPDARHPLSTTWPWSIKPSLAVLWGVCWMFYDHNGHNQTQQQGPRYFFDQNGNRYDQSGNMVNEQGDIIVPSQAIDLFRSSQHTQQYPYFPAASQMPRQRNADGGRLPRSTPHSHSSEQDFIMATAPPLFRGGSNASAGAAQSQANPHVVSAVAHGPGGLAIHGTNNTYTAAPPTYDAHNGHGHPDPHGAATNWLPEDGFAHDFNFHDNAYAAPPFETWQHLQQPGVPNQQQAAFVYHPQPLPPLSRGALTPAIRVTTEASNIPQQPQDLHHSPTPVSSTSSHPSQAHFFGNHDQYLLSPQTRRIMAQEQQEMQTPPRSPQQAGLGDSTSRKRSHSEMSEGAAQGRGASAGSRSGSVASNVEHSMGEEYSPRNRTLKRDDPPMNNEHKYICTFSSECSALTFDRKCEWSKHMDKHDRPYRCPHPSCAKLQGFTYSGGLLRHEREVHGKHGGPKTQMMCPHEDCKRHSGKGFTRKENLNEHIRRVHQSKDYQSQTTPLKREATDAFPGADDIETPASDDVDRDERSPVVKRRRMDPKIDATRGAEDVESLLAENRQLRQMNEEQAARLHALEAEMALLREQVNQSRPEDEAQT